MTLSKIRLHKKMAARIIRVGLPTGIQNMVISFSNVLVQASVNSYGAAAMAGFAAYMKIDGFNILPVSSISMAATTFVGQNYGAAGVAVPVPGGVDPVGAAPLLRHRRGVHPLPGVLGTGCRAHDPLRLEGQVDGISRMKKAPLTCGQGSFLVTASQTAKTGMRCR